VAEAVTLAHLARPIVLAMSLDPALYEIVLACDFRYKKFFPDAPWTFRHINSKDPLLFLQALAKGTPVYSAEMLRTYVRDDGAIIEEFRPDLIVGDFRLSLSISARVARIAYMAVTNAYWSPYTRQSFPLPEHPMNSILGLSLAGFVFRLAQPMAFAYHSLPMNRVRREYGLQSLGLNLRRIYTDADYTLYADIPELIPTYGLPSNHCYLGPILWSPPVGLPEWWNELPRDRPVVYVTLGSSGQRRMLPIVLAALEELPVSVVAATAGNTMSAATPANAFLAEYLPGMIAVERSSAIICNGGSPTSHQALAAGKPVLGIASNMDQFLNMAALERAGAGVCVRADRADAAVVRTWVMELLANPKYRDAAATVAHSFAQYRAPERFAALVKHALRTERRDHLHPR